MNILEDTTSLDTSISYKIYRTARLIRLNVYQLLQQLGSELSPEQWVLLHRLHEKDGSSQVELSDQLFNDHPNITRMIDALEKQRLVERHPDPGDRRKYLIFLTREGKAFIKTMLPAVVADRQKLFSGFSQKDLKQFVQYLDQIEQNLLDE